MPAPISKDLRQRIVDEYQNGKGTQQQLAGRFCVGDSSVQRFHVLFSRTGSVAPIRQHKPGPKPLLDEASLAVVRQLSEEFPDFFDHEIAEVFCERTGLSVSARTINRAFHKLKLTRKKKRSSQHNEATQKHRKDGRS
jgi:transposase